MTEPTPIHLGTPVGPVEQTVDGLVPAPAGLGESTAAAGLEVLYGYELFFYQGVDAFEIFTGVAVDEARLREGLNLPRVGR